MSTTHPPQSVAITPDERLQIPDAPDAVFGALVADNALVCSRCYLRLRRRRAVPWAFGDDHADVATWIDYDVDDRVTFAAEELNREYFETEPLDRRLLDAYPTDGPPTQAQTTYCRHCGHTDTSTSPPTRSTERAVRDAANVSLTLEEFGVEHDWVRLLERVDELKRTTDGDDQAVFGQAVADAIRSRREDTR